MMFTRIPLPLVSLLLSSLSTTILAERSQCPSTPLILPTCAYPPDPYLVVPSKGKGLGLIARHDLDPGTIILREPPILTIVPPDNSKGTGYPMPKIVSLLHEKYDVLSEDEKHEILALHYHVQPGEVDKGEGWQDALGYIFRTNAYNTGDEIGLFPKIARINHSCRPNAGYTWNAVTGKRVVYASRFIAAGEEIFDSYIPLLLEHWKRQIWLETRYGFVCTCPACSASQAAIQESDQRRLDIQSAFRAFEPHLSLPIPLHDDEGLIRNKNSSAYRAALSNAYASIQLAELVEQEELVEYYAQAYKIVAVSWARVGDWERASLWANRGFERRVIEDPGSGWVGEMEGLTKGFIARWRDGLGVSESDLLLP